MSQGALAGLRVLDLTDEMGVYTPKLLADLGERWNLGSSLRRAVAAIAEPSAD